MGVGGGRRGRILFWWRWADKALLSGTQGSHEWLCKQPKREGTFPLAESAVKRFPVTVIAAFGGIISVQAVGGGGKGAGRQGKAKGDVWSACEELKDSASENQVPDAERLFWSRAGGWTNVWTAPFPPNGQTPHSLEYVWGAAHSSSALIPGVPFSRLQSQQQLPRLPGF